MPSLVSRRFPIELPTFSGSFLLALLGVLASQFSAQDPLAIKVCYKNKQCSLTANGQTYPCQIGYNGVVDGGKKYEGDGMTPTGIYHLVKGRNRGVYKQRGASSCLHSGDIISVSFSLLPPG